ncbi:MAG: hypothetical protein KKA67_15515 [Spirochaetes bacterium]|nr:hypothetical protein [Spirochaetota bacterium]MBU1081486.1 hypothetical protein [Spirochaetota bacterium]
MRRQHIVAIIALASASAALSSCGGSADLALRPDRSASVSVGVEVPAAVDAKLRRLASSDAGAALFDAKAVAASVGARGVAVRESVAPSPRAYRGSFEIADIQRLLASDPELSRILEYGKGPGWASLRVRIDRGSASALARLFPGLDGDLLEALQPPALYDNPVSAAEYRTMLSGLLGSTAARALDGLAFALSVSLPGAVLESGGDARIGPSRRSASLSISALEAMVLDEPVSLYVKWAE